MGSKQATVASFVAAAPPGEVGKKRQAIEQRSKLTLPAFECRRWYVANTPNALPTNSIRTGLKHCIRYQGFGTGRAGFARAGVQAVQ
jgi:hypothetical protein